MIRLKKHSWPKMKGLLFVAHGSRREESNQEFKQMVSQLKVKLDSSYDNIDASFLEFAKPCVEDTLKAMIQEGVKEVCIYPFFLNSGKHVHKDIPQKISEIRLLYPDVRFELLPHFGSSAHILDVVTNDLKDL